MPADRAFEKTLERVDGLIDLHPRIHGSRGRPAQYVSDILRGALVLGVAALDALVADSVAEAIPPLAKRGVLGETVAKWIKDESKAVLACFAEEEPHEALAKVCREQLTVQTFQRVEAIEGVLRDVLGCAAPWERAAQALSVDAEQWTPDGVKRRMNEFVERRNRIVHNGDLRGQRGTTQPIRREYVEDAVRVIRAVGGAVGAVIAARVQEA